MEEKILKLLGRKNYLPANLSELLKHLKLVPRDEPDLRETLYEYNPTVDAFELADESQSGFRMCSPFPSIKAHPLQTA